MWTAFPLVSIIALATACDAESTGERFLPMRFSSYSWDKKDKQSLRDTSETTCGLTCFLSSRGCSFYSFNSVTKECSFGVNNEEGHSTAMVITPDEETEKTMLHVSSRKTVTGNGDISEKMQNTMEGLFQG